MWSKKNIKKLASNLWSFPDWSPECWDYSWINSWIFTSHHCCCSWAQSWVFLHGQGPNPGQQKGQETERKRCFLKVLTVPYSYNDRLNWWGSHPTSVPSLYRMFNLSLIILFSIHPALHHFRCKRWTKFKIHKLSDFCDSPQGQLSKGCEDAPTDSAFLSPARLPCTASTGLDSGGVSRKVPVTQVWAQTKEIEARGRRQGATAQGSTGEAWMTARLLPGFLDNFLHSPIFPFLK